MARWEWKVNVPPGTMDILKWLVRPGDRLRRDQEIIEINTDKVATALPAPFSGRVIEILVPDGSVVEGEVVLAILDLEDPPPPASSRQGP